MRVGPSDELGEWDCQVVTVNGEEVGVWRVQGVPGGPPVLAVLDGGREGL